ncbi:trigger factor, partial [Acinetobacter baumannii]
IVRQTWPQALEQAKVQPAGSPSFEIKSEVPGQPLSYVVSFDVFPEITLGDLSALTVNRPQVEVADADVERLVENLRKARRTLEAVTRPIEKG